jgi:hypothetical protein
LKPENSDHVIEQDPLEGGRGWLIAGAISLAFAVFGFAWTSRYTDLEYHDSLLLPASAFAGLLSSGCLVFGTWLWLRFRKFGHSFLETNTPVAGSPWKGVIRTRSDLATKGDYTFLLTYEESRWDAASKKTRDEVIWKATSKADCRSVRSSVGIPFEFAPPGKELKKSSSGGVWWLKVSAPMTGVNYMTLFNVTFLLDKPPKDMPPWGQFLTDLIR